MIFDFYNLTEEEKEVFNRKISAYTEFINVFGDRYISFRTVAQSFTKKEILSEDMNKIATTIRAPENVIDRIQYVTYNVGRYINEARELGIITEEKMSALLDRILNESKTVLEGVNEYTFWELFGRGKDIFYKIINNKKTHLFEQKNIINMIDNTIANDDFDDSFVEKVLECFPDYNGFILTLTNPNVPYEKKYNTLKKSFKQKYFNDYVYQLSKNMTDLNDLDTFIDITITNNNRIKEKNKNIWNVLRRIFIGTKLTSVSYNSSLKNKKDFFEKYSKIITPTVLAEYTADMYSDYHINNNMSAFIADMYGSLNLNDKLDLCISNDYLFRSLLSESTKKMFEQNTDVSIRNKIIKLNKKREGTRGLSGLVNIYSTSIIEHLNNHYDENIISDDIISVTSNDDDLSAKYYNMLSDDIFDKHVCLCRESLANTIFIISDMSCYGAEKYTTKVKLFLDELLRISNHKKRESIYNKIFKRFESDDFSSNLMLFGSDIISEKNRMVRSNYGGTYFSSACDVKTLFKKNLEWFKAELETYFSDKTTAINNLEEILVSYDLLANI